MTVATTYRPMQKAIEKTRYLDELRMWLRNHLDARYSMAALAADAGVSITWLQRSFKRAYGCSIFKYTRKERLLRAQKQLEVTSMNIKSISVDAGYNSVQSFTAAFSAAFGITPARFRRNIK